MAITKHTVFGSDLASFKLFDIFLYVPQPPKLHVCAKLGFGRAGLVWNIQGEVYRRVTPGPGWMSTMARFGGSRWAMEVCIGRHMSFCRIWSIFVGGGRAPWFSPRYPQIPEEVVAGSQICPMEKHICECPSLRMNSEGFILKLYSYIFHSPVCTYLFIFITSKLWNMWYNFIIRLHQENIISI